MGIIAALMLNIGKGVQKYKVHVFLQGRKMFSKAHRSDLGIWVIGLLLTALAGIPFSFGLKFTQSPSAISAMTGIGLVGLTIFAVKFIHEKLTTLDLIGVAIVVFGTSILAYLGSGKEKLLRVLEDHTLFFTIAPILGILFATCLAAIRFRRIHGISFGITAGFCLGLTLFFGDAALIRSDGSILKQFYNPYPYIAITFAIITTIITQLGFLRGRALEVVPALNSATIITPLVLEIIIYKIVPPVPIFAIIALLLLGVYILSIGAASRAVK